MDSPDKPQRQPTERTAPERPESAPRRSGEGAASALRQLITQAEEQRRHSGTPGEQRDAGPR